MRFSEHDLLELWAVAETQHPIDRALSALSAGSGVRRGELADLPIGERDARLFALYRGLAGSRINAVARCPACGEASEVAVEVDELCPEPGAVAGEITVEHDGVVVRCRQPSSHDLAAAARAPDEETARARLVAAAVVAARRGEVELDVGELDAATVAAIETGLGDMTPPVEILLGLACASCGNQWPAPLDIGDVVWAAAEVRARRAMDAVVELGRAYGWTEDAVLALPPARRRYYLERA